MGTFFGVRPTQKSLPRTEIFNGSEFGTTHPSLRSRGTGRRNSLLYFKEVHLESPGSQVGVDKARLASSVRPELPRDPRGMPLDDHSLFFDFNV